MLYLNWIGSDSRLYVINFAAVIYHTCVYVIAYFFGCSSKSCTRNRYNHGWEISISEILNDPASNFEFLFGIIFADMWIVEEEFFKELLSTNRMALSIDFMGEISHYYM